MQQPDATKIERFIAESAGIRSELYQFCVRRTGSLVDAEDVVQDTLAHAYFRLDIYREDLPMRAWLFTIAKNKCIDLLRRKSVLQQRNAEYVEGDLQADTADDLSAEVSEAFATSIRLLPPRQRVALIMKDVMGLSLREIAESLDATVEGVRSLVARARRSLRSAGESKNALTDDDLVLMKTYVEAFNARNWDAVSSLLHADAACEVSSRFVGHGVDSFRNTYFKRYSQRDDGWFCTVEQILDDLLVVVWSDRSGCVEPYGLMKLVYDRDKVAHVVDYSHVEYVSDALREQVSKQGLARKRPASSPSR